MKIWKLNLKIVRKFNFPKLFRIWKSKFSNIFYFLIYLKKSEKIRSAEVIIYSDKVKFCLENVASKILPRKCCLEMEIQNNQVGSNFRLWTFNYDELHPVWWGRVGGPARRQTQERSSSNLERLVLCCINIDFSNQIFMFAFFWNV